MWEGICPETPDRMEEIAVRTAQPLETLMNPRRPVTTVRAGPEGQHPSLTGASLLTHKWPLWRPQLPPSVCGAWAWTSAMPHLPLSLSGKSSSSHAETQLQSPHFHQPGLSPAPPCLHARGDSSPDLRPPSRPFSPEHRWPGSWEAAPWGDMGPQIPWDTC